MHRALTVVVAVAVLAGSVPAAATLADGTPADAEPGASFSGVVGVQEAEVSNEMAERSLDQRLKAAQTNESKAGVVAGETDQLQERLAELEAKKAELKQAYENGSISKGEYQARLAVLSAELRAVERQANRTADVAETLPEQALREKGANASEVRAVAQQAKETGGGEVAEAARSVAGEGVGNGLGNAPNGTERGPPADAGNGAEATEEGEQQPDDAGQPADARNDTAADAGNGSENGTDQNTGAIGGNGTGPATATEWGADESDDAADQSDAANRSTERDGGSATPRDGSSANGTETPTTTDGSGQDAQNDVAFGNPSDWLGSLDGAFGLVSALPA